MASITPIAGVLGKERAIHLLRRATFGPTIQSVNDFASKTIAEAVESLLIENNFTDKPLTPDSGGASFLDENYLNDGAGGKLNWTQCFWLEKMLKDNSAFMMTLLFWNNHFAISAVNGQQYIRAFKYYKLLQKHALGNFRTFIIEMTKDPLMLYWLDGNDNQKGVNNIPSNENYARELQELFMIGATRPDGTPNYTESDVREAARVLTGWRVVNPTGSLATLSSQFVLSRHDTGNKQFSDKYQNKQINGINNITTGDTELAALIDMVLAQPESAKFICRKLYQWFVGATISTEVESSIIAPLAETFRSNNFNIKPVIAQLISSEHFFSEEVRGIVIKHPLHFVLNIFRFLNIPTPDIVTQTTAFYNVINRGIRKPADDLQMDIMRHETVFGWDAYYQPEMYKLWINSTSIRIKNTHVDFLVNGYVQNSFRAIPDSLLVTEAVLTDIGYVFIDKPFPDETDRQLASKIIEGYCFYLYPKECTPEQVVTLRDRLLLQGELDVIGFWFEWKYYKNGDTAAKNGLKTKLNNMLKYFWKSAEAQLI